MVATEQLLASQVSNEGIGEPPVLTGRDEEIQTRSVVAKTTERKGKTKAGWPRKRRLVSYSSQGSKNQVETSSRKFSKKMSVSKIEAVMSDNITEGPQKEGDDAKDIKSGA